MKRRTWLNMLMLTALAVGIVMSWDGNGTTVQANSAMEQGAQGTEKSSSDNQLMGTVARSSKAEEAQEAIPEDAIRLRILAHSDEEADQAVKRQVRDAVVEAMNGWLEEGSTPRSREEAKNWIESHLEQIQNIADEVVAEAGYAYGVKAELKVVPFPAKLYGGQAYPAGNYEALRITLGSGEGQNWWCVLFPPLCFVDGTQGTAVAAETGKAEVAGAADTIESGTSSTKSEVPATAGAEAGTAEREVRFFLWDVLVSIFEWVSNVVQSLF
ncbi:stage II sporulation protein R [Paenibacillus agilis]|uniref:Stage II sporulation protein R n=1 Tax=Paenibacillus agilis TaxID=3020863 RepID=A0A559IPD8_9BACL|nr:stage II sporulation protein R [Paenibacillus agilis]TVX89514.1 stage II sporulation protein R [Paenibacillus agilis]